MEHLESPPPDPVSCYACEQLGENAIDDRRLYVRIRRGRHLCSAHWKQAGRPGPEPEHLSELEMLDRENETRRRMTSRGGADRHLVRKGAT